MSKEIYLPTCSGPKSKFTKVSSIRSPKDWLAARTATSTKMPVNALTLTGISGAPSNDTFAAAAGLGLDIAVNQRFSIRPFQMDYLYTNFNGNLRLTANQNSWRYLGGVVLTFGGKPPIPPTCELLCFSDRDMVWGPGYSYDQHAELQSKAHGHL